MLKTKRIGTFLVRFSSKEQKYCINSNNKVSNFFPEKSKIVFLTGKSFYTNSEQKHTGSGTVLHKKRTFPPQHSRFGQRCSD